MATKGLSCEVCGKRLPVHRANRICSDACRAKRSREKRAMIQKAAKMGFQIDEWTKLLVQGVISPEDARGALYEVNDRLHALWNMIEEREAVNRAKQEK